MTYDQAEKAVDAIFEDLRDRRFLKLLFCENPDGLGAIMHDANGAPLNALDLGVQNEIREAWISILMDTQA